ncbi:MAG: RNA polymerase sporulation sigma factor SigH [Eubacteriaceae bacterium]|nr:RNA polymerase sporulation sigma factor SigH [Eubacteriaceae bacterium]
MITADQLTDEQLVILAQNGDRHARETIMERYLNLVKSRSRSYYIVGGDREDIIQEGLIGLFKAVKDYRIDRPASFKVFAEMCMHRQIMTAIKSATRLKHNPLNSYLSLDKPIYDGDSDGTLVDTVCIPKVYEPEEVYIGNENLVSIETGINGMLSNFEKRVYQMYMNGKNYTEMAVELNKANKSIDNALQRIKKKIYSYMKTKY